MILMIYRFFRLIFTNGQNRTPNPQISTLCVKNTKSLDEYAGRLAQEILDALKG
jgi:hypothetical protein